MSLWTFCESVVTATVAAIAGLENGAAFGGEFDLDEVRRQSLKTPAIFVTCEATEDSADGYDTASMVMIIVTRSTTATERSPAVMALASKILGWIKNQDFDDDQVKEVPKRIRSKNLYGAKADKHGVHLWAVTWDQLLELVNEEPAELPPAEIVADWNLDPTDINVEKTDEIDLNP